MKRKEILDKATAMEGCGYLACGGEIATNKGGEIRDC